MAVFRISQNPDDRRLVRADAAERLVKIHKEHNSKLKYLNWVAGLANAAQLKQIERLEKKIIWLSVALTIACSVIGGLLLR